MYRPSWKNVLFVLVIVAALLAVTDQASAWWGCCRPAYYGCYGCYSPCYSCWDSCSGCNDGWYLGWRPGPVRRLLFGRYRWYYGGYYSSCYGCYSDCCVTTDVDCCGATTTQGTTPTSAPGQPAPTPAAKPVMEAPKPSPMPPLDSTLPPSTAPAPTPTPPAGTPLPPESMEPTVPGMPGEQPKTFVPTPENSGVITVWVPHDAKVTVNGLATKSTGSRRQFVSYGLKSGYSYKYEIHAEVARNGQIVEENRTVVLTTGQDTAVVFGFDAKPVANLASAQ